MFVICLVEEHIFTVPTLRCPVFKYAFVIDTVFCTQPLPINGAHCPHEQKCRAVLPKNGRRTLVTALAELNRDDFSWHLTYLWPFNTGLGLTSVTGGQGEVTWVTRFLFWVEHLNFHHQHRRD